MNAFQFKYESEIGKYRRMFAKRHVSFEEVAQALFNRDMDKLRDLIKPLTDYQIELLYYYAEENGKENKYDHVIMDEFWASPWEYNLVYMP